jgi:hypothetical protein
MDHAIAFLDWDRWVADCPSPSCTNALEVAPEQDGFRCGYWVGPGPNDRVPGCGITAPLDWPDDPAAVKARFASLPDPQRHWHPRDDEPAEEVEEP